MQANATPGETVNEDGFTEVKGKKNKKKNKKNTQANGDATPATATGGAQGGGPKPGAKAQASAQGAEAAPASAQQQQPPPKPHEEQRPRKKKDWTEEELSKVCHYFQTGSCYYGDNCKKDHILVPYKLRDKVPVKGGRRQEGGDTKGGGKGGGPQPTPKPVRVKLYCKKYLETGSCDDEKCDGPYLDADAVKALHTKHGDNIDKNGWLTLQPAPAKGKGKGKGKGKQ